MRTWPAEELFIRAYAAGAVAAQGVWDLVKGVERITKPKRRTGGFDEDAAAFHPYDTPNPYEPALDDNELVAVRQLIEERFPLQTVERDQSERADTQDAQMWRAVVGMYGGTSTGLGASCRCGHPLHPGNICLACGCPAAQPASAPVESTPGTGAGSNVPSTGPSGCTPTLDGASPSDACDIPPSPSEGRPPHPVPREQRIGTYCEDYELDGCSVDVCPEGCYHALKMRDDAAAEWIGGAVPVIQAVLAEHRPAVDYTGVYCNTNSDDGPHDHYENWAAWHAHISPLIANALAPQPKPVFPRSAFITGYRAAIDVLEAKAQGDLKLGDLIDDSHMDEIAEWAMDVARYMRVIEPK